MKKSDDFLRKICGFWIDFQADFKPLILKQDKADQCRKAHTKGDDRLYRKGRYHQATDFGGGAGRTYGGFWIRLRSTRFTAASIPLCKAKRTFTFRIGCPAASFAIPSPCLITQGWWKAARIQRFWLPTANMQRCGMRRQSIMCSLQQHNNAAPGENEKMKEKAKKAAVLLTSVQKCDLIYTERFGIVKTAGARTKQLQIAK